MINFTPDSVPDQEHTSIFFTDTELTAWARLTNSPSVTPAWAFPKSSATITTEDAVITEDLKNVFYLSAGISYWFNTKKDK